MRFKLWTSFLVLVLATAILSPVAASAQSKEEVESAEEARDDALTNLRDINGQLDAALLEYHEVNGELETLTYNITLLLDRVQDYEGEVRTLRTRAEELVVQQYQAGGSDLLEVALEAESIQDILTSQIILSRAADTDVVAVGRLDAVRREMDRTKADLEVDQTRVAELRALSETIVGRLDVLQRRAAEEYETARQEAAEALAAYEAEQARLAALAAARAAGPAGGVGDALTPGFRCPVPGAHFINDWGFPRSGGRTHKGTDMFAGRGTPVLAVHAGRLTLSSNSLGGIVAYLRADHGVTYYYAHLNGYAGGISSGQRVSAGETIAFVGNTGNAIGTRSHLHFQMHPGGGAPVNPYPTLRRHC